MLLDLRVPSWGPPFVKHWEALMAQTLHQHRMQDFGAVGGQ